MGLFGLSVGGLVVAVGGYFFYASVSESKLVDSLRKSPFVPINALRVLLKRKSREGKVDESPGTAAEAEELVLEEGQFVLVEGILKSDRPIVCSIAPGKVRLST